VRVTRVTLRDFRNYEAAELELCPGLNVVHGPNGAGKTNLLEAIYLGCTGRSCRTANERELVRAGAPLARVELDTASDDGPHRIEVGLSPGEPKRLRVDGNAVDRLADSSARPLVSVFLPDRLELVKGPPASRRGHLDQFVAALWPARAETRAGYTRALAQRNALIARVRAGASRPELLDPWDAELGALGARLMADRREAVELVRPVFGRRAEELGLIEGPDVSYRPRSEAADGESLAAELRERRDADLDRGFTGHGPHRDELALAHAGRRLREFGSQGEQRTALLALLFAERDVLVEARRTAPLMLLDDVMSELDRERRGRLIELVRADGQAVVTTTDPEHVPGSADPAVTLTAVERGAVVSPPAVVAA
jgi:DNA replication and repair protein RecF